MPIKKKLFRLNISVLILGMLLSAAIAACFLGLAEDTVENTVESGTSIKVDENALKVSEILGEETSRHWTQLQKRLEAYGYTLVVYEKGQEVYSGPANEHDKEDASDLIENLFEKNSFEEGTKLYFHDDDTYVGQYIPETDTYVLAAHFSNITWWKNSLPVFILLVLGFLCGMAIVFFLLSFLFAWKTNRMIMKPLKIILSGTEQIKNGDFNLNLQYEGEQEFEKVCTTFNDMAHKMLKDQEVQMQNEQARTDMVTGISHDLRTPLTSIQGYIKGVLDGIADTEEKRRLYLNTAYESTEEMNILLQKLFDFSRLESGQIPFHMVPCDLEEYTALYVARKEEALERKNVILSYKPSGQQIPEISMDVEQIRRILDNLLENSMKYAKAEQVHIDVSVSETENEVVLEWKDNGSGVPKEKLEKIFQRFYRCDESRTEKGSGVGLYIVQSIMASHGGKVTAENDSGLKIQLHFPRR